MYIHHRSSLCSSSLLSSLQDDALAGLDFGELNLTSQDDDILDEAAGHIQENLEDELVQEALRKVREPRGGAYSCHSDETLAVGCRFEAVF